MLNDPHYKKQVYLLILVAGLGYFVDIYDLILFLIVKEPSLLAVGVPKEQVEDVGRYLLNVQMVGMLIGGIIWGILGDKRGRLSTLFFTILLYSVANIANGFVQNVDQYAVLRFIAGIGLAGELGIGITLVSEVMTKETRGYGTAIVSGVGIAGAALAYYVTQWTNWQWTYWIGGILGLLLLLMRVSVNESKMFNKAKEDNVKRGDFLQIFRNKKQALKYLYCILIGMPVWFVIGVLIASAGKFATEVFHVQGVVNGGKSVMFHYVGASTGAFLTGFISQWLKSRKKALYISLTSLVITSVIFFSAYGVTASTFYFILFILGIAQGYWSVFVTVASEQFGTNMRATVATTVPNMVRGTTVLMTMIVVYFGTAKDGHWEGAAITGAIVIALAFFATYKMQETYGKDLNYIELAE
jgi:MFS transporter, putative metabolite:H+ symporter